MITGLAARPIPSHSLAIDLRGNLIVNIGALSNGCAAKEAPSAPGRDPCPELETSGGIWSFQTDKTNQTHQGRHRASRPDCTTPSRSP